MVDADFTDEDFPDQPPEARNEVDSLMAFFNEQKLQQQPDQQRAQERDQEPDQEPTTPPTEDEAPRYELKIWRLDDPTAPVEDVVSEILRREMTVLGDLASPGITARIARFQERRWSFKFSPRALKLKRPVKRKKMPRAFSKWAQGKHLFWTETQRLEQMKEHEANLEREKKEKIEGKEKKKEDSARKRVDKVMIAACKVGWVEVDRHLMVANDHGQGEWTSKDIAADHAFVRAILKSAIDAGKQRKQMNKEAKQREKKALGSKRKTSALNRAKGKKARVSAGGANASSADQAAGGASRAAQAVSKVDFDGKDGVARLACSSS